MKFRLTSGMDRNRLNSVSESTSRTRQLVL
jgi:hypothetical protein